MGKKVSFEIDTDIVQGPSHRTKSTLRQTIEDNQASDPPAESESLRDPIVKLDLTKRLKGGDNGKVEMTESPKQAKAPKGRAELTKAPLPLPIDPKEGEDDPISPKS